MSTRNSREEGPDILERSIEALLFASDTPLSVHRLMSIMGAASAKEIRGVIESINRFYREYRRSFEIVEVAGGYQIITLPNFSTIVAQLFKNRRKSRLSQPALEALAIIAYKQPVSRIDIESIRGVNSEGVLSTLIERELVAISGRGEGLGRPYLYSTTPKFLEYLGLKDHKDLPNMEELEKSFTAEHMPVERMNSTGDEKPEGELDREESEEA